MNNLIIMLLENEIAFLEKDLNNISEKIRKEKNEELKNKMIKTKEEIYNEILEIENKIDTL